MKKQKILSKLAALAAVVSVIGAMSASTFAYESNTWNINSNPHIPSIYNKLTDYATIAYTSAGYRVNCSSYTGESGSYIKVTSSYAGGINNSAGFVLVTSAGNTQSWTMNGSSSSSIKFTLTARFGYMATASGKVVSV